MKRIHFILAILSLFIIAACAQQPAAPVGGGTPVGEAPTQAVPAPGVDPDTVDETVVVQDDDQPNLQSITNFEECAAAGNPVLGSFPRQCNADGENFVEEKPETVPTVNEIEVTARQWEFSPNPIVVNQGELVRLKITSVDVTHGFNLPEFGVRGTLNRGKTTVLEFTADKAGSFSFFCDISCGSGHRNMKGTLIVE